MPNHFNMKQFLVEHFQTPQGLVAFLRSYGAPVPREAAVDKWFRRESVPSEWIIVLLTYLQLENGGPVPLYNYLKIDDLLGE